MNLLSPSILLLCKREENAHLLVEIFLILSRLWFAGKLFVVVVAVAIPGGAAVLNPLSVEYWFSRYLVVVETGTGRGAFEIAWMAAPTMSASISDSPI